MMGITIQRCFTMSVLFAHCMTQVFSVWIRGARKVQHRLRNSDGGDISMSNIGDLQSTVQQISNVLLTNHCHLGSVTMNVRYFDGTLKHIVYDNLSSNETVTVSTGKQATAILIAGTLVDNNLDVYASQCTLGERDYIRYSDGLCYKYFFVTQTNDASLTCSDDQSTNVELDQAVITPDSDGISIRNNCPFEVSTILRYYDNGAKHFEFKNIKSEEIVTSTDPIRRHVSVSLVAVVSELGQDVYEDKCSSGDKNFIKYSDGLCYKYHYGHDSNSLVIQPLGSYESTATLLSARVLDLC